MMFALPAIIAQDVPLPLFSLSDICAPIQLIQGILYQVSGTTMAYATANPQHNYNVSLVGGVSLVNLNNSGIVCYTFDGINDYLQFPTSAFYNWANRYQQYTVLLLFNAYSGFTGERQIVGSSANTTVANAVQITVNGTEVKCTIKSAVTGSVYPVSISASYTSDTWQLLVWSGYNIVQAVGDSNSFIRVNGNENIYNVTQTNTRPFSWSSSGNSATLRVGGSGTAGEYFVGAVAEFIYIPYALTMEAIYRLEAKVTGDRNLKYLLPDNHPYKNTNPTVLANKLDYYIVNTPYAL